MGISGVQGAILGCLSRVIVEVSTQIIKWFLIIQFGILKFLESQNVIVVDWEKLTLGAIQVSQVVAEQSVSVIVSILETGSFGIGFFGGYAFFGKFDIRGALKV